MADIDAIARRIADIVISPNAVSGFADGVISVPEDLGFLVMGFFDTDSHSRFHRETERIRMMQAIRHDLLNFDNLKEAITRILEEFEARVSEGDKDALYSKIIFAVIGRITTNSVFVSKVTHAILDEVSFLISLRNSLLIGNIMLIGGMMERSIRTSDRLAVEDPQVYELLRPRDYDLLYFLIEPAIKPFVDALHVQYQEGQEAFNSIIELAGEKIHG